VNTLVPTLDLAVATPLELVDALVSSSCVFITGHGLTDFELAGLLATGAEFYALPEDEKAVVRWPGDGPWLGWQPVYQGGPSALLLERFEVRLQPGGQDQPLQDWAASFEYWPSRPVEMASAWSRVYHRLHGLAATLTTMIAAGLDLPRADLPAWTTQQHSNLVLNHYLTQDVEPEPGRVRQRPHTDIGGITLLWADQSPGGLEAKIGPDETWVPVHFAGDALLLQAGDLLNLWSGGQIPANLHRVVNPPRVPDQPQTERYSAVFFHHPDLSTWVAPGAEQDGVGVDAGSHVLARQQFSARLDAAQLGTARVGNVQIGTAQIGTAQIGTAQISTAQIGTAQLHSASL
jgi:isopenicillin N synthase-like dioxygenase